MFTPLQSPVVGQKLNEGLGFISSCTRPLCKKETLHGGPQSGTGGGAAEPE